jgi:hypothetical protein
MRGMKGMGVKHYTAAVARKKRMEIRSAVAAGGGVEKVGVVRTLDFFN